MSMKTIFQELFTNAEFAHTKHILSKEINQSIVEEIKSNPTYQLLVDTMGPGRPIYSTKNYRVAADVAFSKNIYVFRAITLISQACAGVPWKVYSSSSDEEITDHPIFKILNKPNTERSWAEFIETVVAFWILSGNSYVNAVTTGRNQVPLELWPLPPDRVSIKPDAKGIKSYDYTINGVTKTFNASDVMHLKMFAANDDLYGTSPVFVASELVDQMNEGNDWNTALLQNSARPSGALVVAGMLADDQFKRLKRQIAEKYAGKRNAGKPLLLEGGLQWQQFSLSPVEMNWMQAKQEVAKEIAIALGVPPEMLGSTQNRTYSNYNEARKSFYTETVLPMLDRLQGHFNMWLVPRFGNGIELRYDKEDIEALHDDKDVVTQRSVNLFKGSIATWNEARKLVGLTTMTNGDFIYFPEIKRAVAIDDVEEFLESQVQDVRLSETVTQPATNIDIPNPDDSNVPPEKGPKNPPNGVQPTNANTPQKAFHWRKGIERRFEEYFESEKLTVSQAISSAAVPGSSTDRARFALRHRNEALSALAGASYLAVFDQCKHKSVDVWDTHIQERLCEKATKFVTDTLSFSLYAVTDRLEYGLKQKEDITNLQARVEKIYAKETIRSRSKMLAKRIVEEAQELAATAVVVEEVPDLTDAVLHLNRKVLELEYTLKAQQLAAPK